MPRSDTLDRFPLVTPTRMTLEWYIDAGGRIEGPVSVDELRARAVAGELSPTDSVSADRVTWVPANTVPELTFPARPRRPLTETVVSGSIGAGVAAGTVPDPGPSTVPVVSVEGYQILGTLGTGACGVVYKALHEKLNRVVALKTVLVPEKATTELINRFHLEARALARLQHPNIVALYDSGMCTTPAGQAFFAMELLDGEDLGARLDRAGAMDERVAWMIVRQAAAALAHAAENGIIHRDVKPANLFLVPPPTGFMLPPDVPMVKMTDFGLALSSAEGDQRQSVAGTLLGTPVYMAPEQFAGSDVDVRADIYSLGCTLYHMLAGAPPFDGRTVWDVMMKKSVAAPRLGPPVSSATAGLVELMLAIEPEQRPPDYKDLIGRIDALPGMDAGQCSVRVTAPSTRAMPEPIPPPPVPVPGPGPVSRGGTPIAARGHSWRWAYALAALVLLAGVGAAVLIAVFQREREWDPTGEGQILFHPKQAERWHGEGGVWKLEDDPEGSPALTGVGPATRQFDAPVANFRMTLSIDPYQAKRVDVVLATSADPPEKATRWLIRLDPATGATFGKQVGPGEFKPIGTAAPIPSPQDLKARGSVLYHEIKYQRAGGKLRAWFRGQFLGQASIDDDVRATEIRLEAIGGAIRLTEATLEELTERKK